MDAADHRAAAADCRAEADRLDLLATRLERQGELLGGWHAPLVDRLVPLVWDGPAAERAREGFTTARRQMGFALDRLTAQVDAIRRRAAGLRETATDHDATASALEEAARRRAAEAEAARRAAEAEAARRAAEAAAAQARPSSSGGGLLAYA